MCLHSDWTDEPVPLREAELLERVSALKAEGVEPHLAVIIVGDDPASHVYVNSKVKTCGRLGIRSTHIALPSSTDEATLEHHIRDLNQREDVHGILVQSPLPPHMDEEALTDLIAPHKDVDGFHPQNLGRWSRKNRWHALVYPKRRHAHADIGKHRP